MDHGLYTYLILFDLSSAFDTLNHDILSTRLNELGIHVQVHAWFMAYISHRTSQIKINSLLSLPFTNSYGVPQGSVLGPLLFIIYITPLKSIFSRYPSIHYHLYADDLQIYLSFAPNTDPSPHLSALKNCISEIVNWFSNNSLSLNTSKTNSILFSKASPLSSIIDQIKSLSIPLSNSVSSLGISFDSSLSFSNHISSIIRSANYHLYNISKSRNKFTFILTKSLISSLVFSRLSYCISLLHHITVRQMNRFDAIQRRAVRTLYKLNYSDNTSIPQLMNTLGWLRFRYLSRYRLLCIAHKAIYAKSPTYLSDIVSMVPHDRSRRTHHTHLLSSPKSNSSFGDTAFALAAPKYWNELPHKLRCITDFNIFKKSLFSHYMSLSLL